MRKLTYIVCYTYWDCKDGENICAIHIISSKSIYHLTIKIYNMYKDGPDKDSLVDKSAYFKYKEINENYDYDYKEFIDSTNDKLDFTYLINN